MNVELAELNRRTTEEKTEQQIPKPKSRVAWPVESKCPSGIEVEATWIRQNGY
jgi:hypothetical protein